MTESPVRRGFTQRRMCSLTSGVCSRGSLNRRGALHRRVGLSRDGTAVGTPVAAAFEVEHTTSIYCGIVRLLDLALGVAS